MMKKWWRYYIISETLLWLGCLMMSVISSETILFKMLWSRTLSPIVAPLAEVVFVLMILIATWCYEKSLSFNERTLRRFALCAKGVMGLVLLVFIALKYLPSPVSQLNAPAVIWYLELTLIFEAMYFILALAKPKSVN